MSLGDLLSKNQRLLILRSLAEANGYQGNETVLKMALECFGHQASRDIVRAELEYLAEHGLVNIEKLPNGRGNDLWVARMTLPGLEVSRGKPHVGVDRPEPV